MSNHKNIFLLDLIILIFPIIFILIYLPLNLWSISTVFILLSLLWFETKRYKAEKLAINYQIVVLVFSFLLYAIYHLGSMSVPQHFDNFTKTNPIAYIKLKDNKKQHIDKVCFYIGIDANSKFTIESKQNGIYKTIYSYTKDFPKSFRWNCVDVDTTTNSLRLKQQSGAMMIDEVKLFDANKTLAITSSRKHLYDEQSIDVDETFYGGMFFDEIYHGRTAFEILTGTRVYETTHPYLGKLIIIPGIKIFGMTPFGWRIDNVLMATLFVWIMYMFAKDIFIDRFFALIASFLLTYSFMHLTQSRIALIDTFGTMFVFISFWYLYRFITRQKLYWLLLSGVFYGLAAGVKWSAVFAVLGFLMIAIYLIISRYPLKSKFQGYRLILYGILSYGIVAVVVYVLTFYDIFFKTGSLSAIWDYQVNMYKYHHNLIFSHPYSSPWWSWVLDLKPMCYYRSVVGDRFSSITVFGNMAIFWMGIVSFVYMVYKVLSSKHTIETIFILFAIIGLYIPYVFIGRIMFIYHFYYVVPFLILSVVYTLKDGMQKSRYIAKYFWIYLVVVGVLFMMYYPVLSGFETSKWYVDYVLRWFPQWWL